MCVMFSLTNIMLHIESGERAGYMTLHPAQRAAMTLSTECLFLS